MIDQHGEIIVTKLAEGMSKTAAYMEAFPNSSLKSAKANASRYLKTNPDIVPKAIDLVRTTSRMTLPEVLEVVACGTEAVYMDKYGKQIDYANRLEAAKVLLRLHGELGEEQTKTQTAIQMNTYNIVNDIGIDKLRELIQEVKHMRTHRADVMDGEIVSAE